MSDDARAWQLVDAEGLVAELVVSGGDFPWLNAEVRPTGRFDRIRPLFEEELRRLDRLDDDPASWEAAYNHIRQAVRLLAPDGQPVPEFLLHVDGHDAWWRWSDEPFPETGRDQNDRLYARSKPHLLASWAAQSRRFGAGSPPGVVHLWVTL